jgi:hypothetical protein
MKIDLHYGFDFRSSSYVIESLKILEKTGRAEIRGLKPSKQILDLDRQALFSPLNWERSRSIVLADFRQQGLSCRAVFDLSDHRQIERKAYLPNCDLYFKRSLDPLDLDLPMGEKLRPLGMVTGQRISISSWRLRQLVFQLVRAREVPFSDARSARYAKEFLTCVGRTRDIADIEVGPDFDADRMVLFQTRTWPPNEVNDPNVGKINQFRMDLAKALQREFGNLFSGGIYNDRSSDWNLLPSGRDAYLMESKSAGIGISTTGLHGSVPWKLFEYFAGSKVVLSQKNDTVVRVPPSKGVEYLEFETIDEALDLCDSVLSDAKKFNDLRRGAANYYQRALKPSAWADGILGEVQNFFEQRD